MCARDELLKPKGWTRGWEGKNGATCAVGAINRCAGSKYITETPSGTAKKAVDVLFEALTPQAKHAPGYAHTNTGKIIRFNDNSKSKARVIALFDKAIKSCEA